MNAGLFIYFPRDPGQNIYFKVFDNQDIYFKKTAAPTLGINCSSPNKTRDQFQPFPNSTYCHTNHIGLVIFICKKAKDPHLVTMVNINEIFLM